LSLEEQRDELHAVADKRGDLIVEQQIRIAQLERECDTERSAGMNDWRTRALEYEAVIWKAYWECDGHFDTWLLENLPDTHARIQNAVKP